MNAAVWATIVAGAVMVLSIPFVLRAVAGRAVRAAAADPALTGALVSAPALFGGGDGPTVPAIHGTGALGLVSGPLGEELVFVLAVPRREIHVPRRSITGASIERSLRMPGIYKRTRRPWLVVRWVDDSGVPSAAGFVVAGPERWVEVLTGSPPPPAGPREP